MSPFMDREISPLKDPQMSSFTNPKMSLLTNPEMSRSIRCPINHSFLVSNSVIYALLPHVTHQIDIEM